MPVPRRKRGPLLNYGTVVPADIYILQYRDRKERGGFESSDSKRLPWALRYGFKKNTAGRFWSDVTVNAINKRELGGAGRWYHAAQKLQVQGATRHEILKATGNGRLGAGW